MKLNTVNSAGISIFFMFISLLFFHFQWKLIGKISTGLFILFSIVSMYFYYTKKDIDRQSG